MREIYPAIYERKTYVNGTINVLLEINLTIERSKLFEWTWFRSKDSG